MLRSRFINLSLLSAVMLTALVAGVSPAADHRDSPNLTLTPFNSNPELRALDLNDVYVFRSPSNPNNTVMMVTVNPLLAPGETAFFSSLGSYELVINNGSDTSLLRPEITFSFKFTAPRAGRQEVRVTRRNHITNRSELIARGQTGSNIAIRGGGQARADVFDDPFFFDFNGFRRFDADGAGGNPARGLNDGLQFDFFGDVDGLASGTSGFNTGIAMVEVPSASLTGGGSNVITVWSRTLNAAGVQIDRTAIPTVNTVLIRPNPFIGPFPGTTNPDAPVAPNFKEQFNLTLPVNDRAVWGAEARRSLGLFGTPEANVAGLADALLPDVLTFNVNSSAGFIGDLNGRQLQEDVIDFELGLVTNGGVTTDGVPANNKPFRNRFPYAATPN
ncbi:MAG: DUF4331 family protein [Planctomycetaceae bacterium]